MPQTMFALGIVIAALVALAAGGGSARAKGTTRMSSPYSVASWAPILSPMCLGAGIPLQAALKWLDIESNGNPCAIGAPGARGPDGHPREIGLVQLWNPDDFTRLGLSQAVMRAPCQGNTGHCARALTADEMVYHAKASVAFIDHCRTTAQAALHAAGTSWTLPDQWKMAKLVHAFPGLVSVGLRAVVQHLGRAPSSWGEYRDTLADITVPDHATEAGRWHDDPGHHLGPFGKVLNNATALGDSVPADATA